MQKYPFLRYATIVLRVVGWIILVVGAIGSIIYGIMMGGPIGVVMAIMGVIFSFLTWLFLLATREFIYILIHVEENTRNTAESITTKKSR